MKHRPWPALFLLALGAVTVLALVPVPPASIDLGWDKLNHVAAFATLSVLARAAWRAPRRDAGVALWLLAWGVWIELAQGLIPARHASGVDLFADALGIIVGLVLFRLGAAVHAGLSRA